jgi:hypothetical protein
MGTSVLEGDAVLSEWSLRTADGGRDVELPVDVGEWKGTPELRAEVWLPPEARGEIRCEIEMDSRGKRWSIRVRLPSGRRDRIVMDWTSDQGPVLA